MNSICVIHPYKDQGLWVFDDDRFELVREPFRRDEVGVIALKSANEQRPAKAGRSAF